MKYDVFVSFMGSDTRDNFTSHLVAALTGAGVNAFIDDEEIAKGDDISDSILKAIRRSKISIVVFSSSYGESRWCLDELVEIMECRRTSIAQQIVMPVFYKVDPSNVRNQKGSFADAFQEHEKKFHSDLDKLFRWRNALKDSAKLAGYVVDGDGTNEAHVIDDIANFVVEKLSKTKLFIAPYVVGMSSPLNEVISLLAVERVEKVLMVGIWGSGGIGKTALAKAVYNELFEDFERTSFVENVRETWKQPHFRVGLQERLLYDTLNREIKISNVDRGVMLIRERLRRTRVLIIIDDVDDLDQLRKIVGKHDWFGPGSRIIITSRDKHVLETHKVDFIYEAEEMRGDKSLELFSLHAFERSFPTSGYSELSKSVVSYCGGLPLALQVLGSFLFGRSTQEWTDTLEKLKKIPNHDIQEKLKISYDSLTDETVRDIFLDISCFFTGQDRDYVQQILGGCDFYPEIGIKLLFERCLITINEQNKINVHDLLRDMAREIVREESPKNPGYASRLWRQNDVLDVLRKNKGGKKVEGISLKLEEGNVFCYDTKSFEKMKSIRLLELNYVKLIGSFEHISKDLKWLCWEGFPLEFLPDNLDLQDVVTMELKYSKLRQVWKHSKLLQKLTYLDLSHSYSLTRTPDFSSAPNLKKLILKDCNRLLELHHSFGDLENLVSLNSEGCKSLEKLPKSFHKLKSLETLNLSRCEKIDHLDEDIGTLVSLKTLLTDNTGIRAPPSSIFKLRNLVRLSICGFRASSSKDVFELLSSWTMPTRNNAHSINLLLPSFQVFNSLKQLGLDNYDVPKHLPRLQLLDSSEPTASTSSSLRLCDDSTNDEAFETQDENLH